MASKRKNKLIELYSEAKLNPKIELITLGIIDLALLAMGILLYWKTKQIVGLLAVVLLLLGVDYYLLGKPRRILDNKKKELENEFVHIFAYFEIFVKNGRPVYNALEDCLRYASKELSEKIRALLNDIDHDKSVTPYMKFAENFTNLEIRQVLVSVYKMSIEGGGEEYLTQFDTLFHSLSVSKRQQNLENEKARFGNFNFLPLLASALSMGIIAVSVVILMEEYANVI